MSKPLRHESSLSDYKFVVLVNLNNLSYILLTIKNMVHNNDWFKNEQLMLIALLMSRHFNFL